MHFYAPLVLLFGGIIATMVLVLYFATSDPHQQFGLQPKYGGAGPGAIQQIDLRDRLHGALVAVGFVMVAQRDIPESYGRWQRDYARRGGLVRLTWNSETRQFTLEGGKSLRKLATRTSPELSGNGLAELIARIEAADIVS